MAFDWQVEHYNKAGKVIRKNDYRMVVDSQGKRMERPPGSGIWYAEDGSIIKDESAAILAAKAQAELEGKKLSEQQAMEAREKLKDELRAELLAEQQLERAKMLAEMKAEADKLEHETKGTKGGHPNKK